MKTRILVVDDEIFRRTLKALINQNPDWEVCGEAANGKEAVEKAIALNPELIVMDVMMPAMNGLDATTQIRRLAPSAKIVLVSMYETQHLVGRDERWRGCLHREVESGYGAVRRDRAAGPSVSGKGSP